MSSENQKSIQLQRKKITDVDKIKRDALEIHAAVFPSITDVSVSLEIPGFVKISNDQCGIIIPLDAIDSVVAFERGEK